MQKIEPPQQEVIEEIASSMIDMNISLATASIGLSSPVEAVSSCIAELIKLPINIARNRKLYRFFNEISNTLNSLSKITNNHELLLEKILKNNDDFLEVFVNSALVAMNQERKIEILKNATINSATKINIDHEQQIQFIFYAQNLTMLQIILLKSLLENESVISCIKCYKELYEFFDKKIIPSINILPIDKDEFRANCIRLSNYYLLNIPTEFGEVKVDYLVAESSDDYTDILRVTTVGKNFIQFMSKHPIT